MSIVSPVVERDRGVIGGIGDAVVVVVSSPGYGACCAGAGAEVRLARVRGVAVVVEVLLSAFGADSRSVKSAVMAGTEDTRVTDCAVRHV